MKRFNRKKALLFLTILLTISMLFSGCEIMGKKLYFKTGTGTGNLFRVGELYCPEEEVKTYLLNTKNIYGTIYDTSVLSKDFDSKELSSGIEKKALDHLIRVYALNLYSEENKIELSDKEKDIVEDAAKEYFDSLSEAEKEYIGATEEDIKKMYEKYALSEKAYFDLIGDIDEEVSEDEARVMEAEVFYVTDESKISDIKKALKGEKEFADIAGKYNEGKGQIGVTFTRNTYPKEFDDVVFRMENDEISDEIKTPDGKIYFVKCINKFNEELSEKNKQNVIESRRQKVIENVTEKFDGYYSKFDTELWNKIEFPYEENLQSDSFFKVLDEHISFEYF
ncbi:MAG: peptidylprolyl isomerase [Lachnospiraceae bacterium]|nr:peptidylprolyl isomerase [Lachnospiraceae bacterium]